MRYLVFLLPGLLLAALLSGCRTNPPPLPLPPQVQVRPDLQERMDAHRFPRLMNQLQLCCRGEESVSLFDQLSDWDVIIVDPETIINFREYLGADGLLRRKNPALIALVYFSGGDVKPNYKQPFTQWFLEAMDPAWLLHDVNGKTVPFFQLPSSDWTVAQNPTTAINQFVPSFINRKILATNTVDGVFYDWATTRVSWLNHRKGARNAAIDIDNDGKSDSDSKIDRLWTDGYWKMLQNSRNMFPEGTLIIGNGGWNNGTRYSPVLNGVMIEQFMEGSHRNQKKYGWQSLMDTYARYVKSSFAPRLSFVMANSEDPRQFQKMRFALASTLMLDGYFCFTNRNGAYRSARWYDEYSVDLESGEAKRGLRFKGYLGMPRGEAFAVDNPKKKLGAAVGSREAERHVWRRDYENGIVLVNPGNKSQSVLLQRQYRKILGSVNPQFNDGTIVDRILLGSGDGIILLNNRKANQVGGTADPRRLLPQFSGLLRR